MKWFKHDSDASSDAKIRKLIMRHGAVGYAVYFHCLELIAGNVSNDNITFELEHDSEIVADNLRIIGTGDKSGRDVVEGIMRTIIDLELFENNSGRITCFKMIKRLDSSMTSNTNFRQLITEAKENHDKQPDNHDDLPESHDPVMTESCPSHDSVMLDKTRQEQTRTEKDSFSSQIDEDRELQPSTILKLYNTICTSLPRATKMTDKRRKSIKALKGMFQAHEIEEGFKKAQSNPFLCGGGSKNWKADFDWLINCNNLLRVIEGRYDDNATDKSNTNYLEGLRLK